MSKKPTPSLLDPADDLTQVLGPELAKAFLDHRKVLKAPLTQYAAKLMAKKLAAMPDPVASVEQSMLKGWRDVFPISPDNSYKSHNRPIAGVEAERDRLRKEIEDEQRRGQGQADQNSGHAGWLLDFDRERPERPH